jgi:hypothetical protein
MDCQISCKYAYNIKARVWSVENCNAVSAKTQEMQHGRDKKNTTYSIGQNSGYNITRNYGVIGK